MGSVVSTGFSADLGTTIRDSVFFAQSGSFTGLLGAAENDSLPPKPLPVTGLPDGCGVRMARTAWSGSSHWRATRLTSSTVTASNAAFMASGDSRCWNASAVDQALARPGTEFFCDSSCAIS